ncbi:unnamed protein product [Paramecium pentaurelia]|uniref:CBM20 domain-containing protein n=1 Tax=Paramecium pentaurelia TaxID=43138 RepID=A0A8S1V434_9CILI|nr:unnamed protein product [Paramecium pentaurelia]
MSIQINFKVRCETQLHQQLYIVGDIKLLGEWNPFKGLKLNTYQEIYPCWTGTIIGDFEPNCLILFKAVIIGLENIIWEQNENRALQIKYQSQSVIFTFDSHDAQLLKIKSFFDNHQEFAEETANFFGARRRYLKKVFSPLDFEYASSDSDSEHSNISSLFNSSVNSKNSSYRHLDNPQQSELNFLFNYQN